MLLLKTNELTQIIYDDNKALNKFFIKHHSLVEEIKNEIKNNINNIINHQAYKIKTVNKLKYKNHPIYEYKLKCSKIMVRVAFICFDNIILIVYISSTLIKQDFCKEMANFN